MPKMPLNGHDPQAHEKADQWMRTQLALSIRELEARFGGANVTLIVSMPGCGTAHDFPPFSHATSAQPVDLHSVLRAMQAEMRQ